MPKSVKKSKSAKKSKSKCEFPATICGLKKWFTNMFEELGWMILADHHEYKDKIVSYKSSLARLKDKLECKIKSVKTEDKKEDLKIMHDNVKILIKHVKKYF